MIWNPFKEMLSQNGTYINIMEYNLPINTGRIQFKVLTTLLMTISSFLLEFKGF